MSLKITAIVIAVLVILIAIGGYFDHTLSYTAGGKARDAQCVIDRAADKSSYESAQTSAVAKAAAQQKSVDAQELQETQQRLADAQRAALTAQSTADDAKATAASLNATLSRLKNENKDVNTWSDACLPSALLVSLHNGQGQTTGSVCR